MLRQERNGGIAVAEITDPDIPAPVETQKKEGTEVPKEEKGYQSPRVEQLAKRIKLQAPGSFMSRTEEVRYLYRVARSVGATFGELLSTYDGNCEEQRHAQAFRVTDLIIAKIPS